MGKIISAKKLTDYRWLNLYDVIYLNKAGETCSWMMVSRRQPFVDDEAKADAVVIVAYHTKLKKLVVVKEFRVPLGGYEIGFPAGLIDKDETPLDAAYRELQEETGLTTMKILKQSPVIYSTAGMSDESVVMVYLDCIGTPSNHLLESSEDIETMLLSQDEVKDMLQDSSLKFGAKAWFVMDFFARTGVI